MLKLSARIDGIRPEIAVAISFAQAVFQQFGFDFVITSGTDSSHSRASRHYLGMAFDVRNRHIPSEQRPAITAALKKALGPTFDVVPEGNHWHIEYDPKTGLNL